MDIGEEITRSYYGPEQAFVEQSRQPLHVHPLFELALEKQLEARKVQRSLSEKGIAALITEMREITDDLDECVILAEMLDMPVVLSGEGIVFPATSYNIGLNLFTVKPVDSGPVADELGHGQQAGGLFFGFDTRIEPVVVDGIVVGVRPVIVYQVKTGDYKTPHARGDLYATGDVGKTQIEFTDDVLARRISETLSVLMENTNETIITAVNSINVALAKEKKVNAVTLKHIGHQVDILLECDADQRCVDSVIDLIGHYVDWTDDYHVETGSIIKVPRDGEGHTGNAQLFAAETTTKYSGKIDQLIVRQNMRNIDGVLVNEQSHSLYAVSCAEEATWYTRLTDIKDFNSL